MASTSGIALFDGGVAAADPGFCGVRVAGPQPINHSPLLVGYTIRNKCNQAHSFALRFPTYGGRQSVCKRVDPTGYASYATIYGDSNWYIVNC